MQQQSLFDIVAYPYMGRLILLSQRDIEQGKGLIRASPKTSGA